MFERVQALRSLAVAAAMMAAIPAHAEAAAAEAPQATDAPIVAVVDQARLVRIPPGTQTLVIGNPTIADVTLLRKNNLMVLTPKAFGETNFIALDANGNQVAESTIQVVAGTNSLIVQRGTERQSYSCAPRCQPIERLGDDEKYMNAVAGETQAHNARLSGAQAPVGPGLISAK